VKAGATDLSGISMASVLRGEGPLTRRDLRADTEFILTKMYYG